MRAVWAFIMVSAVVKVFEAMMKSVVSGFSLSSAASMSWPSTFETKCICRRGWLYWRSARQTIFGPRSEPPMPMLTMSVIGLPV